MSYAKNISFMKTEEQQFLEIKVKKEFMIHLFEEGHFLSDCRDKQDVLSEGSEYYLCRFEDKQLWSLVQKKDGKSIVLGSKHFDQHDDSPIIDLWTSIKKSELTDMLESASIVDDYPLSSLKQKRFQIFGMHQGWEKWISNQ